MSPTQVQNARIRTTSLGYEDHGIFTAFVMLEGDGWGCGFGGYALDNYDKVAKQRWAANGFGLEFIRAVMRVAGVESWEKLPGCFVRAETEGLGGQILRIGHITKDDWFDPKELAARFHTAEVH